MARKNSDIQPGKSSAWVVPLRDKVLFPGATLSVQLVREPSDRAVNLALSENGLVLAICEQAAGEFLCEVGTLAEVMQTTSLPDGTTRVVLRGLLRCLVGELTHEQGALKATFEEQALSFTSNPELDALLREAREIFLEVASANESIPHESIDAVLGTEDSHECAQLIAHYLPAKADVKIELLRRANASEFLDLLIEQSEHEQSVIGWQKQIRERVQSDVAGLQKHYFLREQMRAIQAELGAVSPLSDECTRLREAVTQIVPVALQPALISEIDRLESLQDHGAEASIIRNYLDVVLKIPFGSETIENAQFETVADVLSKGHFGLHDVKERLLEFVAVRKLRNETGGAVLCFVGPPGVGKTSFAQSIATALNRKTAHIALGGLRDEAEIRGHRRTYVGARAGRVIQALIDTGTMNPVIVLDELDKAGSSNTGDPMSALLELLDPSQNHIFTDHFLGFPVDLSKVIFVATANRVDTIPHALVDRIETIEFTGYSDREREEIGAEYLLPKLLEQHGLNNAKLELESGVVAELAKNYTREAGVRALDRIIAKLLRKVARKMFESPTPEMVVAVDDLKSLLGLPEFEVQRQKRHSAIGIVHSLVVTNFGGDEMQIEVSVNRPLGTEPRLTLTGSAGQLMEESVRASLTCVRAMLDAKGVETRFDVHVHLPQIAIPKDGPSAGLAVAIALFSVFTGRDIRGDVAITGELNLRGHVLAVGGVREKLMAAERHGYMFALVPPGASQDVPTNVKVVEVATLAEALERCLVQAHTVSIR